MVPMFTVPERVANVCSLLFPCIAAEKGNLIHFFLPPNGKKTLGAGVSPDKKKKIIMSKNIQLLF